MCFGEKLTFLTFFADVIKNNDLSFNN